MAMARPKGRRPDPKVIREAVRRVVEVAHPVRVILFGSAARGEMGPDSDLDLLVEVRGPVNRFHLAGDIYCKMIGVGAPVDILVATTEDLEEYRDDPGMIYGTVLEEGKVVYAE